MSCPLPLILGLEGFSLSADERRFFKHANPLGFILFRWNIEDAAQVKALIQELKMLLSRAHLPILVDAEGGDVWRLNASFGDPFPHPRIFGDMFEEDPEKALSACCRNYFLIGKQHKDLGFTVNCAPLLDLMVKGADSVIGMRSFSSSPQAVAALGAAAIKGLLDAGMVATIKHMPGHGAAQSDSHDVCPHIKLAKSELEHHMEPFRVCLEKVTASPACPWGMTAHCLYTALDTQNPATFSHTIIRDIVRDKIAFKGFLVTDDLYMGAVDYLSPKARVEKALAAGCDAALYGRGGIKVYEEAAQDLSPLSKEAYGRSGFDEKS